MGYPDSNQERQDQNLQCYHYTIAQFSVLRVQRYVFLWKRTNFSLKKCNFSRIFSVSADKAVTLQLENPHITTLRGIDRFIMKETTQQLVNSIVEGLQEKKGHDIVITDLSNITEAVCAAFVICTANSPSHVQALVESVGDMARKTLGARPTAVSGLRNGIWAAMDYQDVIVHVLLREAREFYDIEHLWADATLTALPDEY